ncbi:MAG TPA: pirin family protein [Thermodesulfobacteriota bacterium]|nr:pirin family protein [Thermodesulfobacteriota bacterium]
MKTMRRIKKVWKSRPTLEGAGVHLKRAFGYDQVPELDPFLLLDDFRSDNPAHYLRGFPWHPHRGIETITYVLQGDVEHGDSIGNSGVINSGDVQWMTAGSGIIHQEMPKGDDKGIMSGFQLWANLPASHKMMTPRYREVKSRQIPEVHLKNGAKVKIICGEVNGVEGPVRDIVTDPKYLDVTVPAEATFTHSIRRGQNAFAYVIEGEGYFDPNRDSYGHQVVGTNYFDLNRSCLCKEETMILYGDGEEIIVTPDKNGVRFLLVSGRPIGEPVAWYGPIVMNTQEELRVAFEEYQNGTFVKYRGNSSSSRKPSQNR